MNPINAEPHDGGEQANKRERVQLDRARKENTKNGSRFTVNWAAMGVLLSLIAIYLTYAGVKHTWPFGVHCPVVVDVPPNSVEEAHAGGAGFGIAEVFWLPPKCAGSDHPISRYQVTTWRMINGVPAGVVRSIVVAGAQTSVTITGLDTNDIYSFHVSAVNSIGPSRPVVTNSISPVLLATSPNSPDEPWWIAALIGLLFSFAVSLLIYLILYLKRRRHLKRSKKVRS
jgi:Fibronectin type III domain